MKKKSKKDDVIADDDMLPEYDFSGGVRGKHYRAMQQGYTVTIHKIDGSTTVKRYPPAKGIIQLDPDVRRHFPDSESVNTALRSLISLFPRQRRAHARAR
ncbi:MAG: hypothetical protein NTX50_00250 [Candidatus Sumerlaeota bacterium]|nr:hypothetical protein [Candidatus Sumerlaeota bacterium]